MIELAACGRFTADERSLYHTAEGYPPFHVLGPPLPSDYAEGKRFSIYHRSECWMSSDVEQLGRYRHKVWSLQLVGEDFDDSAIGALPDLPALEILELQGSPSDGSALKTLIRYPRLRVVRLQLSGSSLFALEKLPRLPTLTTLDISGLPVRPWGFKALAASLPALSCLSLESPGDLVLDGEFPNCASSLDLKGCRVMGNVSPGSQLNMLGLHLSGASGSHVEELLANVEVLRSLSLRDTPIDELTAMRLAARLRPDYFDLVNTGLSNINIRNLAEAHPKMRILPNLKFESELIR